MTRNGLQTDAIITDWSGVISDDLDTVVAATNEVYALFGVEPITAAQFCEVFSADWLDHYQKAGITVSREEILSLWKKGFEKHWRPKAIEGSIAAVRELRRRGKMLIVASAQEEGLLMKEAGYFEVRDCFTALYANVRKDKPEQLTAILKAHNLDKERALFVGDIRYDILFGHGAGVRAVGVLSGYHREHKFRDTPYAALLPDFQSLLDRV